MALIVQKYGGTSVGSVERIQAVAQRVKGWRDRGTASSWDLVQGVCTAGELEGSTLEQVAVTPVFWFAWSNFYPNTQVVKE